MKHNNINSVPIVIIVSDWALARANALCGLGAFLWDDPDQDQWSKITLIMVHERKELMNPFWTRILRFLWCTMFRVILDHWSWSGSSQRNTPPTVQNLCVCCFSSELCTFNMFQDLQHLYLSMKRHKRGLMCHSARRGWVSKWVSVKRHKQY